MAILAGSSTGRPRTGKNGRDHATTEKALQR
jgi:hypothetical protein